MFLLIKKMDFWKFTCGCYTGLLKSCGKCQVLRTQRTVQPQVMTSSGLSLLVYVVTEKSKLVTPPQLILYLGLTQVKNFFPSRPRPGLERADIFLIPARKISIWYIGQSIKLLFSLNFIIFIPLVSRFLCSVILQPWQVAEPIHSLGVGSGNPLQLPFPSTSWNLQSLDFASFIILDPKILGIHGLENSQ